MYEVDTIELRKCMADLEITTASDLAKKAGINRVTAEGILRGDVYPSSMVMNKIAKACNMSGEKAGRIFFKEKLA